MRIQREEAVSVFNDIHKNITNTDTNATNEEEWRVRVEFKRSRVFELRLPKGENTTVAELSRMCVEATGIRPEEKAIIECGFPKRSCEGLPETCAIGLLGVRNRDSVSVETEASLAEKKEEEAKMTSAEAVVVVDAADTAPQPEPAAVAAKENNSDKKRKLQKNNDVRDDIADAKLRRKLTGILPDSEISSARMLDDPDGRDNTNDFIARQREGMAQSAAVLLRATQGGATAELRNELRNAVDERMIETQGRQKVAAVLNNQYEIKPLPNDPAGRLLATYAIAKELALKSQHQKSQLQDVFPEIPKPFLIALLKIVAENDQDRVNLVPERMAMASPRVFWNVVKHAAGTENENKPIRSFALALEQIAPGVADWEKVCQRERLKPSRYSDYVSH
jgi:hypothetical protein